MKRLPEKQQDVDRNHRSTPKRCLYNGITFDFQSKDESSILSQRSNYLDCLGRM